MKHYEVRGISSKTNWRMRMESTFKRMAEVNDQKRPPRKNTLERGFEEELTGELKRSETSRWISNYGAKSRCSNPRAKSRLGKREGGRDVGN
jgi:hypothetical protein